VALAVFGGPDGKQKLGKRKAEIGLFGAPGVAWVGSGAMSCRKSSANLGAFQAHFRRVWASLDRRLTHPSAPGSAASDFNKRKRRERRGCPGRGGPDGTGAGTRRER
jgi:hypothetical protein